MMATAKEKAINTLGFKVTIGIAGLVGLIGGLLFGVWDSVTVIIDHAPPPVALHEMFFLSLYSVALYAVIGCLGMVAIGVVTAGLIHTGTYSVNKSRLAGVFIGLFVLLMVSALLAFDIIRGNIIDVVDQHTVICILSDHGFASFRRTVHLNSWLVQNGLMVLKKPALDDQGDPLFKNVVWERTKAYAVGFSSIYLNLRGREGKGIVNPGREAEQLKRKIASVLTSLRDPKTGRAVIRNVYTREDLYSGPYVNDGPDLVVGFEPHYRASWQTAIGGVPPRILEDNQKNRVEIIYSMRSVSQEFFLSIERLLFYILR